MLQVCTSLQLRYTRPVDPGLGRIIYRKLCTSDLYNGLVDFEVLTLCTVAGVESILQSSLIVISVHTFCK